MVLDEITQVYRLVADVDRYVAVTAAESDITRLVEAGAFRGEALASQWNPLRAWYQEEYPDQKQHEQADLLGFVSGCVVLTDRALGVLRTALAPTGEFLPLLASTPMYVFNCTNVIAALDTQHTKGVKFPSGNGYLRISSYAMRQSVAAGHDAFKVPERVASDIFVSHHVASIIAENHLSGARLIPLAAS